MPLSTPHMISYSEFCHEPYHMPTLANAKDSSIFARPLPAECYSCLVLQGHSTQLYPLSHPRLSCSPLLLYPLPVYSPAWREHWHVWSTKQIPQQALLFPVEGPGLGGMLTLHYSTPPRTQCPRWTTRFYLRLLGSQLGLFLSLSPFLWYSHWPLLSPPPPLRFSAHMCDRQNIRITVWADIVTRC